MNKVKVTIRLNKNTNNQIQTLAKDNHWNKSKVIRFILEKSLSDQQKFSPAISIKRTRLLKSYFIKIFNALNHHSRLIENGYSLLNQLVKSLNILVKYPAFSSDLANYLIYSVNSVANLKGYYQTEKLIESKVNQIWSELNK